MVFLPGDHVLNTSISVANVASLTMCGESSSGNRATVVCNGPVGLSFMNMVNFKMYSLAFTSCNRSSNVNDIVASLANNSALFLYSTQSAELVNCSFHDNFCTVLAVYDTNITLAENKFTHNHCVCDTCGLALGCSITARNSNMTFTGTTAFLENSYSTPGTAVLAGAIWVFESLLHFNGTNNFIGNVNSAQSTLGGSGAVYATTGSFLSFTGVSNFINNSAHYGGGAIYADTALVANTTVSFSGTSSFINNSAGRGGAIYAQYNVIFSFIGSSIFIGNSARSVFSSGGAIYTATDTSLSFTGDINFSNNSAEFGGAIRAEINTSLSFSGTTILSANLGGAIYTSDNSLVSFRGTSNMDNNLAEFFGGAISARDTTLTFEGTIHFTNNKGTDGGGGLYLSNSVLSILPNTTAYWTNNRATLGGAIYVDDSSNPFIYCTQIEKCAPTECFFLLPGQNLSNGLDVQLVFENNSADDAGSVLFGGAIDNCKLTGQDSYSSGEVFDMLVHIEDDNTNSSISSQPFRICPCENNLPNCGESFMKGTLHPGETFQASVVAVGQRNGTVSAAVRSTIEDGSLQSLQYLQQANNNCTTLDYTVFSLSDAVYLNLYEDGQCSKFGDLLQYHLTINQTCPPGFDISESERSCTCEQRLQRFTNSCNITSRKITRESGEQFWVGYNRSDGLILHPNCPFDYCVNRTVNFSLTDTDLQCAYDRSGLLCGACDHNYSLVLGTSQCRECTNSHLVLLIPFAVMGVALVFLLLVCKLTVATGTLSGLVFYANIVGPNRTIFLPMGSNDVLLVFTAWLNLDFGIETCFFDGMDAYSKTWLQFVFPVYIWLLVGLMIAISHYSHRFANLLGNNPVSILATLILLSYTKILRTLIAAINITYLQYPEEHIKSVWLYDANIDYLVGKHIPLFLVAVLVFLFLFLPYTLLLLFGQWLQAISHLRLFSWVNRLTPLMDSYHAPYKPKHRYWPGLLLVLRFVLLLVFALNPQQDPSINLLAILVGTGILVAWAWVSGGVYRNWCLDALECSFALNLIVLVGATSYVNHSGGNQLAVGYTSVSIALVTFIGILTYHIFQQLRSTKLWKKVPKLEMKFNSDQAVNAPQNPANNVTEVGSFNQLREPLLEDLPQPNYGAL